MSDDSEFTRRALVLSGIGGLGFFALGARMAQLQIFENKNFRLEAAENQFNYSVIPATRGAIYDRFGIPLAINRRDFRIMILRSDFEKREIMFKTIDDISAFLGRSAEESQKLKDDAKIAPRFMPIQIASNLSYEQYTRLSLFKPYYQGFYPEMGENRNYPLADAFAHLIGYVAKANDEEAKLDKDAKHPAIRVGKEGLEKSLEQSLKGKHGARKVEVDAHGKIVKEVYDPRNNPVHGEPVVLTIDAELQQLAYDQMAGESGSIVLMDVRNGELLVLASAPGFNTNKFVDGIKGPDYKAYLEDEKRPLYHKAVRGLYPPGSTYKPVTGIAALENGVTDGEETVYCPGFYEYGGNRFHCHSRRGHGRVNLHDAIKVSCDVYFYEMGRRVGEKMGATARKFGFGTAFDIGIPGVAKGYAPDAEWKMGRFKKPWEGYDSINMSIGQGLMISTPLQLAVMTARIASGGKEIVPTLIRNGPPIDPSQIKDIPVDKKFIERVHKGMIAVSNEAGGTARADIGVEGVIIAGKTGTAQVRRITKAERASGVKSNASLDWKMRDHGLFISYAPADNPKYCAIAVIEHGGSGSKMAAPKAREVLKAALLKDPSALPVYDPKAAKQAETDSKKGGL